MFDSIKAMFDSLFLFIYLFFHTGFPPYLQIISSTELGTRRKCSSGYWMSKERKREK